MRKGAKHSKKSKEKMIRHHWAKTKNAKEIRNKIAQGHWSSTSDHHGYGSKQAHKIIEQHNVPMICELCGSKENLDIHHKDGNVKNNNLTNLQILCRSCHTKLHVDRKKLNQ